MRLDADDLDEAIAGCAWSPVRDGPQAATDRQILHFRQGLMRLVSALPGDTTVSDLRALLGVSDD